MILLWLHATVYPIFISRAAAVERLRRLIHPMRSNRSIPGANVPRRSSKLLYHQIDPTAGTLTPQVH